MESEGRFIGMGVKSVGKSMETSGAQKLAKLGKFKETILFGSCNASQKDGGGGLCMKWKFEATGGPAITKTVLTRFREEPELFALT